VPDFEGRLLSRCHSLLCHWHRAVHDLHQENHGETSRGAHLRVETGQIFGIGNKRRRTTTIILSQDLCLVQLEDCTVKNINKIFLKITKLKKEEERRRKKKERKRKKKRTREIPESSGLLQKDYDRRKIVTASHGRGQGADLFWVSSLTHDPANIILTHSVPDSISGNHQVLVLVTIWKRERRTLFFRTGGTQKVS
jgi:hypothetical protein